MSFDPSYPTRQRMEDANFSNGVCTAWRNDFFMLNN
jgi:hypothetical protein